MTSMSGTDCERRIEFLLRTAEGLQKTFHDRRDELAEMLTSRRHIDASHYARVMEAEADFVPWKRATELAATSDLDLMDAALEVSQNLTRELLGGEEHWNCEVSNGYHRRMRDGARDFIRMVSISTE